MTTSAEDVAVAGGVWAFAVDRAFWGSRKLVCNSTCPQAPLSSRNSGNFDPRSLAPGDP